MGMLQQYGDCERQGRKLSHPYQLQGAHMQRRIGCVKDNITTAPAEHKRTFLFTSYEIQFI